MSLLRLAITLMAVLASHSCFRFIEENGIHFSIDFIHLVIFSILLLFLNFLFRLYYFHLNRMYGPRVVFLIHISLFFVASLFYYTIRIFLYANIGFLFADVLTVFMGMSTCVVSESGSGSGSGNWKQYIHFPFDSEGSSAPESKAVQQGSSPSTSNPGPIEPSVGGPITSGSPTDSWFAGAETEISRMFPNLAPAGEEISPHSGAGASHSTSNQGAGVEVFERPSSPAPEDDPRITQTEVASQLALREREACAEIKNRIIAIPRLQEKFAEAEHRFPGITLEVPPAKAVDLILEDLITGEDSRRGMGPGAEKAAIRAYKHWLSRVERGSNVDSFSFDSKPQGYRNDIDIEDKIVRLYERLSETR
uniref:hypothetical protein n=1 Tax=Jatropha curcas TaxID=180498 RepID=UPI002798CAEE|nr:hypothetical protein QLP06_mgp089 [Jatropha curcas]WFG81150.1 hypothetical protein [Jatropha curcas]